MILLVDDEEDVRFMISLYLEDAGVEWEEAISGEEALERSGSTAYDMILLDQRMPPGMTGIEVAETMRSRGTQTPIVLYSAYLDPTTEQRAHDMGLRTIDKGEPDRLMEAVREYAGQ